MAEGTREMGNVKPPSLDSGEFYTDLLNDELDDFKATMLSCKEDWWKRVCDILPRVVPTNCTE